MRGERRVESHTRDTKAHQTKRQLTMLSKLFESFDGERLLRRSLEHTRAMEPPTQPSSIIFFFFEFFSFFFFFFFLVVFVFFCFFLFFDLTNLSFSFCRCPKPGLKFGADWILYKRGPQHTHASYQVIVLRLSREQLDDMNGPADR